MDPTLHFHDMRDDVNGAGMPRIERQRLLRNSFGAPILSILLKGKSVHHKDARITRHLSRPVRQRPRHPVAHPAPPAKVEVERMCDRKREHVARPVGEEGIVQRDRMNRIALEPSARGPGVRSRRIIGVGACRLDRSNARGGRRPRGSAVGAHDEGGAQTVPEDASRIVGEHALDLGKGVATLRQQHVKRAFAALQRIGLCHGNRGRCCVMRPALPQCLRTPSRGHDRRHCPVGPWLAAWTDHARASSVCIPADICGCLAPPMTQVPDFLLEMPKVWPSSYGQA